MSDRPAFRGVTVDSARSRELDDAFWVEKTKTGYRLTATVADVASLVPVGSLDDEMAFSRGLTVYAEGAPKAAMLDIHIAQGMASLLPGRQRPVVACIIDYDEEGEVVSTAFQRGTLTSAAKLDYESLEHIHRTNDGELAPMVGAAVELARTLWRRRVGELGLPEWEAAFDVDGALREDAPEGALAQTVVHEFMVATNTAAAEHLRDARMPMIYRNQGPRSGGPTGRYEFVCRGHASLGKHAYGQFTSPIRRYPDLVNQRVLCAAIEGEEAPYDIPQLARICAAANRAAQRAEAASRSADGAGGDIALDRLDFGAFRNLLARAGGFDQASWDEFVRRLGGGLLTHADLAWFLFGADSVATDELKADLLNSLAASPEDVDKVWQCGINEHGLEAFSTALRQGSGGRWQAFATVGNLSAQATASDPVKARGVAVARLASAVLGLGAGVSPAHDADALVLTDVMAKRQLLALCRVMNWPQAEYVVERQGDGFRARHRATVRVQLDDFLYETPLVHAATRRAAEILAANVALAALEPYADELLAREMRDFGIDMSMIDTDEAEDRPLYALTDFCRRHRARQRIVWISERPGENRYECVMELAAGGNTLREKGVGTSRIDAMDASARAMITSLLGVGRPLRRTRRAEPQLAPAYA